MYSPIYHYEVDGQNYECSSSVSSSKNPGDGNGTVYYDSKNPSKCMTEYAKSSRTFLYLMLILPIVFIAVGLVNIIKTQKRVKQIKELNETGKLVKNLPYSMERTSMSFNGRRIQRPVVEYVLPSGQKVTLKGDPRYDYQESDQDGMVDLIIDEQNPDNYFIDFEINRISGNLPQDYSQQASLENYYNPYAAQQPTNVPTTYGQPQTNYQFSQSEPVTQPQFVQQPVQSVPTQPQVLHAQVVQAPVQPQDAQTPVISNPTLQNLYNQGNDKEEII